MKPVLEKEFHREGRGPELIKAWMSDRGLHLRAIDFYNPEDVYNEENKKHLLFVKPKGYMVTPEEEFHILKRKIDWENVEDASIFDLGRSEWAKSFLGRHSSKCRHYLIMFYDEYLDILCEGIEVVKGSYKNSANQAAHTTPTSAPR